MSLTVKDASGNDVTVAYLVIEDPIADDLTLTTSGLLQPYAVVLEDGVAAYFTSATSTAADPESWE